MTLVVTSALTSADVSLTSGSRSPDETDGAAGSVTHSIFVRFTSNFVHLHPLPPLQERVMSRFSLVKFFLPKFLLDRNLRKSLTGREIPRKKGLGEAEIQKLYTTAPEHLTDDELLLSTFCAEDLARKHSGGWDNDHPKCRFCGKGYRFRTFATQCHMTSQIKGSGKQSRVTEVCSMESKTDDALKATFLAVRKEIYNRFTTKQQNEQQAASASLKRSMTERERDSEVLEIDTDITALGASKKTNRTVTDLLIKKPSHEDFVAAWSEAVFGKGLTFDFFSDPLVRKAILVTAQCADSIITSSSTHGKDTILPRRTTWTAKILPTTDDRLQQEAMQVLTPLYKEIGACFMGDGWQSTSNRPILNILAASDAVHKRSSCL